MQAGLRVWKLRLNELAEEERQQRKQAERDRNKKRRDAVQNVETEVVMGRLSGGWSSDELTTAEAPLEDLIPELETGTCWIALTETGCVIYGASEPARKSAAALALTPIGKTVLERLAKALAPFGPGHDLGSPTIVPWPVRRSDDGYLYAQIAHKNRGGRG